MGVRQLKSGCILNIILQEMRNISHKKSQDVDSNLSVMVISFKSKIFIEQKLRAVTLCLSL